MGVPSGFLAALPNLSTRANMWVSGSGYLIGEIVVSLVDFCNYIRKIDGFGSVDPSSDTTNWQPYGARARKSLQRIAIVITAGSVSATGTISSVVTAKSTIRLLGGSVGGNDKAIGFRVDLTNSTTVTAYSYNTIYDVTIGAEIEETY